MPAQIVVAQGSGSSFEADGLQMQQEGIHTGRPRSRRPPNRIADPNDRNPGIAPCKWLFPVKIHLRDCSGSGVLSRALN